MSESLARFRELKGVGPAIEARLHEAGVFTWEALSQVIGRARQRAERDRGDRSRTCRAGSRSRRRRRGRFGPTARRTRNGTRRSSSGSPLGDGRRADPRRRVTHVRTQTENSSAGWSGRRADPLHRGAAPHGGLDHGPGGGGAAGRGGRLPPRRPGAASRVHVVGARRRQGHRRKPAGTSSWCSRPPRSVDIPELAYQATLARPTVRAGQRTRRPGRPWPAGPAASTASDRLPDSASPRSRSPRVSSGSGSRSQLRLPAAQRGRADARARLARRTVSRAARRLGPSPP